MNEDTFIAIIAASSVIAGVLISQAISLLLSFYDKKHKKQILLRQKYEEMMFHFSDSLSWIQSLHNSRTRSDIFALAQSPQARKALSLCLLYFSDLVQPANKYILAQTAYYSFVVGSFDENKPFTAGGQALVHPEAKKLCDDLMNKKIVLENIIVEKVDKYIKA